LIKLSKVIATVRVYLQWMWNCAS